MTPLKMWIVSISEPLPVDAGNQRPLRMGIVADMLLARGHDVTWWASTFDHAHKRHRFEKDTTVELSSNFRLELLHGCGYRTNVSLRRLLDHRQVAQGFERRSSQLSLPDVIVASMPSVELAAAAARVGRVHGVTVIVDVRDQWPDIFVDFVPTIFRTPARIAVKPFYWQLRRAFRSADAILAMSPTLLSWALHLARRPAGPNDRVFMLAYPEALLERAEPEAIATTLSELGVDSSKKLVWFVGMFGRSYDLSTVIRAAKLLGDQGYNELEFVLSGKGQREAEWQRQAAGQRNVVFTGWINRPQIAALQLSAWAGLAAYALEAQTALPNKLFEFMAGGLPVLSSLGHDAQKLIETYQCGLTYKAGDPADLASAVEKLLKDEALRAKMAANSLSAFRQHFAAEVVYENMVELIEGLVQTRQEQGA